MSAAENRERKLQPEASAVRLARAARALIALLDEQRWTHLTPCVRKRYARVSLLTNLRTATEEIERAEHDDRT